MSRVSIGTEDGFDVREVVVDLTTTLDIRVQLDGANATLTAASCKIVKGNLNLDLVVTTASGVATAPISPANLTSLGLAVRDTFKAFWQVTIADGVSSLIRRYEEVLVVATKELVPSLQTSQITSAYTELARSESLPTGQTTWWTQARDAWRELRSWTALQGASRAIWMIENPQATRELHYHWTLMKISLLQDGRRQGSELWQTRSAYHAAEVERLKSSIAAYFSEADQVTAFNQDSERAVKKIAQPKTFAGRMNSSDVGKL